MTPLDIEFLLREYLSVFLSFDKSLHLEFSAAALDGDAVEAAPPYAAGASFEAIFGGLNAPLRTLAERAQEGRSGQAELSVNGPGGPVALKLSFMPRLLAGRPGGVLAVAENVTRRRAELARLSALEDRLRAILDNIADGIVVIDSAGRIEGANHAAARICGRSPAELVGERVSELMGEPYRSAHQGHVQRYLESGRSGILNVGPRRLPLLHKDGSTVPIELSVGEAWIAGRRKFVGVVRDLTQSLRQQDDLAQANAELKARIGALEQASEDLQAQKLSLERLAAITQKAREAAEEASRAKSRFVATVSHELRTPLNGILAVADMLTRRELSAEARDMAEIILSSGRSLLVLLNDILDLAKVEAGALQVSSRPFALAETLEAVADMWRLPAEAKGLRLETDFRDLPDTVAGDPGRLRQVLSNLVSNAVKFTDGAVVTLRARGRADGEGRACVRFVVADEGPGVPPALRERIFEPFVQADSGDSRRHPGSGLGLAICRELVGLMGGRIWADAAGERGTAMVMEIPFPLAGRPEAAPADSGGSAAPAVGLELLVAEDHPANRRVMGLILDEVGWRYVFAQDGREAVEKAAGGRFDAILMDLQMPRMDGLAATRAIRRLPGPAGAVPVIGVTAAASADDMAESRRAGMDAVVAKPIDPALLIAAVGRCLAGQDAQGPGGARVGEETGHGGRA